MPQATPAAGREDVVGVRARALAGLDRDRDAGRRLQSREGLGDDRADDRPTEDGRAAAEPHIGAPWRGSRRVAGIGHLEDDRDVRREPLRGDARPACVPVSSCPATTRATSHAGRVGREAPQDLEAGVDPYPVVEAVDSTRPFGSDSGGPSSTIGSPGRTSSKACSRLRRADVDAEALPRDLALLGGDDDAANLARGRRDPDALPHARRRAPAGELTDREEPVLARVAHRHPDLVGVREQPQDATAGRALHRRDRGAEHVGARLGADRRGLARTIACTASSWPEAPWASRSSSRRGGTSGTAVTLARALGTSSDTPLDSSGHASRLRADGDRPAHGRADDARSSEQCRR